MERRSGTIVGALLALLALAAPGEARAQVRGAEAPDAPAGPTLAGLPLVEVKATGPATDEFAVLVSGDGGWATLEKQIAGVLAGAGIPVTGLSSLRYFWTRKTPDEAARDLERILLHSPAAAGKSAFLLVGYSRGADVLPFMVSRLPADLRARIRLLALLGPSRRVDFKLHLSDIWSDSPHPLDREVLPEVKGLLGQVRVLCVYGADEKDTICPELSPSQAELVPLQGAHHFDHDYPALGQLVLRAADVRPATEAGVPVRAGSDPIR